MKKNNKGFTLAELLIVVAIIAVLVGISLPVFTTQLEKSREATDLANVRSAYATVMLAAQTGDSTAAYNGKTIYSNGVYQASIPLKQTQKGWQSTVTQVADVTSSDSVHWKGVPDKNGTCTVSYSDDKGTIFNWGGYSFAIKTAWSYDGSGAIGKELKQMTNMSGGWSNKCTAVDQPLDGAVNKRVNISDVPADLKKYSFGVFAVNPNTGKIIYDSGQCSFSTFSNGYFTIKDSSSSGYTGDVKLYVQLIDTSSTNGVSQEDSERLMQLFSVG